MEKRRRSERDTVFTGAVRVQTRLPSGGVLDGSICDLSYEGLGVIGSTEGLTLGDEVAIEIRFPFGHNVEYTCKVMHINPGKSFGLELRDTLTVPPDKNG